MISRTRFDPRRMAGAAETPGRPLGGPATAVLGFDLDASDGPVRLALALTTPGRHDGHRYRAYP